MRTRVVTAVLLIASCGGGGTNSADTSLPGTSTTGATTTTLADSSWEKVKPPTVEGSTDAVVVNNGTLADGRYWASISRVSGSNDVVFTVARAYFGEACAQWAAERGMTEGCMNDYAVDDVDTALVALGDGAMASVAYQQGPGKSYAISGATLRALVLGVESGPIAGYEWVPFPFVVTVDNGVVVAAEQFWVP